MSRGGTPLGPIDVGCTDVIGSNPGFFFALEVTRLSIADCLGGEVEVEVEVTDDALGLPLTTDTGDAFEGGGTISLSVIASSVHINR